MVIKNDSWDRTQVITQRITESFHRLMADEKARNELQATVAQANPLISMLTENSRLK